MNSSNPTDGTTAPAVATLIPSPSASVRTSAGDHEQRLGDEASQVEDPAHVAGQVAEE
jgi:hypothetical protein